jgi:DNA-binding transcriptional ArsR family regulator
MKTNVSNPDRPEEKISKILGLIGQPARIQILMVIGAAEACVCHLEAALGLRQASISQHLMALRKAGLVTAQREGRNIFYRLARPEILQVMEQTAAMSGADIQSLHQLANRPLSNCPCPHCNPDTDPQQSCQNLHPGSRQVC